MSGPPDDALARLRYVVAFAWDNGLGWESKQEADAALDELQRLREEREAYVTNAAENARRAQAAEAALADMRRALEEARQELWEQQERDAPPHGHRRKAELIQRIDRALAAADGTPKDTA